MSKCNVPCYAQPYEGDQPFIFFSYCHQDEDECFAIIERLEKEGYRVWYDNGVNPGDDWLDVIARHIMKCTCCLAAISEESAQSYNCGKERTWAISHNIPLVPVMLHDFHMSIGLEFQLGSTNYIEKDHYQKEEDF